MMAVLWQPWRWAGLGLLALGYLTGMAARVLGGVTWMFIAATCMSVASITCLVVSAIIGE